MYVRIDLRGQFPFEKLRELPKRVVQNGVLNYEVATTADIKAGCPEVFETLRHLGRKWAPHGYILEEEQPNGVNVNRLHPPSGYELHRDSKGVTLVVFLETHTQGGELVVHPPVNEFGRSLSSYAPEFVLPKQGLGILLDGTFLPHEVKPTFKTRHTLLAMYRDPQDNEPMDPDLAKHLYGSPT